MTELAQHEQNLLLLLDYLAEVRAGLCLVEHHVVSHTHTFGVYV